MTAVENELCSALIRCIGHGGITVEKGVNSRSPEIECIGPVSLPTRKGVPALWRKLGVRVAAQISGEP